MTVSDVAAVPPFTRPLPAAVRRRRLPFCIWMLALSLATALPVLFFAGLAFQQLADAERRDTLEEVQRRAHATATTVNHYLQTVEQHAVMLANMAHHLRDDLPTLHARAREILASSKIGNVIIVADRNGDYLVSTRQPIGASLARIHDREALARLLRDKRPTVTNVLKGKADGVLLFAVQAPIFKDGEVDRILILGVEPNFVSSELIDNHLPPGWIASVVDAKGNFVGRNYDPEVWVGRPGSKHFLAARQSAREGAFESISVDGVPTNVYFVNLPESGWSVAVGVPQSIVRAAVPDDVKFFVGLGVLSLLAATLLGYMVARRVSRQARMIQRSATVLGEGGTPFITRLGISEFNDVMRSIDRAHSLISEREVALHQSQELLRQELKRRELLLELTQLLDQGNLPEDDIAQAIFDKIAPVLDADVCFNYAMGDGGRHLDLVYVRGVKSDLVPSARRLGINEAFCGSVAASRQAFVADAKRVASHPQGDFARTLEIGAYCCHPLLSRQGRVLGTFAIGSTRRQRFKPDEIAFLRLVSSYLARVWERLGAERAITEHVMLLRTVTEHVSVGLVMLDRERNVRFANPAFSWLLDLPSSIAGKGLADLLPGVYDTQIASYLGSAYAGEVETLELTLQHPSGDPKRSRYFSVILEPQRDASELVNAVVGVFLDITDTRHAEEHRELLMREVNHRAKNLLTVVQSVASQTAGEGRVEDFVGRFSSRLAGLAASQDLLVRSEWRGVLAGDLVRSQLTHFSGLIGGRIQLVGPPIWFKPGAAQAIGMALHELTTNAAKYGALSNGEGRITIRWQHITRDGEPYFCLKWIEEGGPAVVPPTRKGFGHTLIVAAVEHALDAEVKLTFEPDGLKWRMQAPIGTLIVNPEAQAA